MKTFLQNLSICSKGPLILYLIGKAQQRENAGKEEKQWNIFPMS